VVISENETKNINPDITDVLLGDTSIADLENLASVSINQSVTFTMVIDEASLDSESHQYQWLATGGEFSDTNDLSDTWTAPAESDEVTMFAVTFDEFGGIDYFQFTVQVTE
jgi:hypothetical protein